MAKVILRVMGQEAKAACGKEQISGGVESGIKGGVHAIHLLWSHNSHEKDWRLLLIDERNAFNKENRTEMLWPVRNEWPSST